MNEYDKDYSKINSDNFTQKDLMQYLLHSTQHVVTREELQTTNSEIKREIQEVRTEIQNVRTELKTEIQEVKTELKIEIQEVRTELKIEIQEFKEEIKDNMQEFKLDIKANMQEFHTRLNKLDAKIDRMQWFMMAGILSILGILLKDHIGQLF